MEKVIKTKPHYLILDGLRGVAAILVLLFHLLEAHASSKAGQIINHGYLAVDFFFMLSGFVIGYAYDDRWNKIKFKDFVLRRIVRLQPMIVLGSVIGAIGITFQQSGVFPNYHMVTVASVILLMVIGFTVLPVPPSMDIRGWNEMHPLNGPEWSLFFEYIANILYGLILRKLSTKILCVLALIAAGFLINLGVSHGDMIGGWAFTLDGLSVGFTRLAYPFLMGLILARIGKKIRINNAFLFCTMAIVFVLSVPRIGNHELIWQNGLYEASVILFIFPLIVLAGAGGTIKGEKGKAICKFIGDISYPLYITHYPLVYIYFAVVNNNKLTLSQSWPVAVVIFVCAIVLAYIYLKLYDEPVRKWLAKKLI
ncbi:acyltransferase [Massilibacteroides sp.]|uniref:acyltransferase family protein n=1 Tax=Massilibacteroides sp. TaxID=2034766 RepID=UPI0026319FD7|nr:acyltransferase [Massilibacteroides sp.]MDD4516702.1 acyltransferase [Massilibacteroides sp.]